GAGRHRRRPPLRSAARRAAGPVPRRRQVRRRAVPAAAPSSRSCRRSGLRPRRGRTGVDSAWFSASRRAAGPASALILNRDSVLLISSRPAWSSVGDPGELLAGALELAGPLAGPAEGTGGLAAKVSGRGAAGEVDVLAPVHPPR